MQSLAKGIKCASIDCDT